MSDSPSPETEPGRPSTEAAAALGSITPPAFPPASQPGPFREFGIAVLGFVLYCVGWTAAALAIPPIVIYPEFAPPMEELERQAWRSLLLGLFAAAACPAVVAIWSRRRNEIVGPAAFVAGVLAAWFTWGLTLVAAFEFAIFCVFGSLVRKTGDAACRKGFAAIGATMILAGLFMRSGLSGFDIIGFVLWAHVLRYGTTFLVVAKLPMDRDAPPEETD